MVDLLHKLPRECPRRSRFRFGFPAAKTSSAQTPKHCPRRRGCSLKGFYGEQHFYNFVRAGRTSIEPSMSRSLRYQVVAKPIRNGVYNHHESRRTNILKKNAGIVWRKVQESLTRPSVRANQLLAYTANATRNAGLGDAVNVRPECT